MPRPVQPDDLGYDVIRTRTDTQRARDLAREKVEMQKALRQPKTPMPEGSGGWTTPRKKGPND